MVFCGLLKLKRRAHASRRIYSAEGPRSCLGFLIQAGLDKKKRQERILGSLMDQQRAAKMYHVQEKEESESVLPVWLSAETGIQQTD